MNIYDTYYMLAAVEELPPERTFFRDRYFPSNQALDVFGTSKVFVDYREGDRQMAPFVVPRIGSVAIMRHGFESFEIEPPNISISIPLTVDHLKQRGFGEALLSEKTPEERSRVFLMKDLEDLGMRISRREEWMAAQTVLDNGCLMRHITDKDFVYEDIEARYYKGEDNPAIYTPTEPWQEGSDSWMDDVYAMAKMLTSRGLPATELVVSSDLGRFILRSETVQKLLDNRRMEMGRIKPGMLPNGVEHLGTLMFGGIKLDILIVDETYEDEKGKVTPYLAPGTAIVTSPDCGRTVYGAVTQTEDDGEFHTYASPRVPQYNFTKKPPTKEVQLTSKPLMAPKRKSPWVVAKKVFE